MSGIDYFRYDLDLRVRKALKTATPGDLFLVECTDPMAAIDIPHMAAQDGHGLERQSAEAGVLVFRIRKAA